MSSKRVGPSDMKLDWDEVARIFGIIAHDREREVPNLLTFRNALQGSKNSHLRFLSKKTQLPLSVPQEEQLPQDCGEAAVVCSSPLWGIVLGALATLSKRSSHSTSLGWWFDSYQRLRRMHRWTRQQSGQSRAQAVFLIGFVPCVAFFIVVTNGGRFLENLEKSQGRWILSSAVILYALGVLCVRELLKRSEIKLKSKDLRRLSGQVGFLTELFSVYGTESTKLARIVSVCRRSRHDGLLKWSKSLTLGLDHDANLLLQSLLPSEHEYIEHLRKSFVESYRGHLGWLSNQSNQKFEDLQAEFSEKSALLSLHLLYPMALFFLPALFLFLTLCGFSLGMDPL